jgi:hypothetical protein
MCLRPISDLASRSLLRSPAHPTVSLGSSSLRRTPRLAANPAQSRRHPSPRPKKSFQETRQIKVRIQLGKVNAQARRTDLDLTQLRGLRIFQPPRIVRQETYIELRAEMENNAPGRPVIPRRNRLRNSSPHTEIVLYPNRLGYRSKQPPLTLSRRVVLRNETELESCSSSRPLRIFFAPLAVKGSAPAASRTKS